MTCASAIERNSSSTCHQGAFVAPPFFLWGTPQARLARDCNQKQVQKQGFSIVNNPTMQPTWQSVWLNHPKQPHSADEVGTCQAEDEVEVQLSLLPESDTPRFDVWIGEGKSITGGSGLEVPCFFPKCCRRQIHFFRVAVCFAKSQSIKKCSQLFDPDFSSPLDGHITFQNTSLNFHQACLLHLDVWPEDESICILHECSGPTWAESWNQVKFLPRKDCVGKRSQLLWL